MKYDDKRKADDLDLANVQDSNRAWWTDHTMSYDWNDAVNKEPFSLEWYNAIDKRFIHDGRLYGHEQAPFDRIIPFDKLKGTDVLEIGCGMGLHSELMVRAGARVTAIDISDTSVNATRRRLELRGLNASVMQMDACRTSFPDASFDFVWSWGVIHHSARTAAVIREISRILRPNGEARIMVYNINCMNAYATIVRDYLLGFWQGRTLDECLWRRNDGFLARHYSKDMLTDILSLFFSSISMQTFGQEADAIPLPRRLRGPFVRSMKQDDLARRANARGLMLFAIAKK